MVGGGIKSTNGFAALGSLRRKKKLDKDHGLSKDKNSSEDQAKKSNSEVYWAPAPLTVKSWADVDEDDDYYATTAPPQSVWGSSEQQNKESLTPVEESESEEDDLEEIDDDDVEEEHDHEPEVPEPIERVKESSSASLPPKETERQLSKKELKKKELAELEAVLAELGIPKKESNGQYESNGSTEEKKLEKLHGEAEKKDLTESKSAKKKKKKDKSSKDVKDTLEKLNYTDMSGLDESTGGKPAEEETSAIDVKERLKKVASMRKKKSNKEMDAAAKAAAIEAAARSAKFSAAKKKEKNHYNQQPVR